MLRALVTNLGIYPAGHPVVRTVADRVVSTADDIRSRSGRLLASSEGSMLALNRETLFKTREEQDYSVMLASWFRERAVDNLLFEPGLDAEELLRLFDWLHSESLSAVRAAVVDGAPAHLQADHLLLNVKAPKSDEDIRATIESMDLAPILEKAGVTTSTVPALTDDDLGLDVDELAAAVRDRLERDVDLSRATGQLSAASIDWTGVDLSRVVPAGQLSGFVRQDNLGEYVDRYLAEHLPDGARWSELDAAVEQAVANVSGLGLEQVEAIAAARAAEQLQAMLPREVGRYLAEALPNGPASTTLRKQALSSLKDDDLRRDAALREVTAALDEASADPTAAMLALENLLPAALTGRDLRQATQSLAALSLAVLPTGDPARSRRAWLALELVGSPEVIRALLHRLEHGARTEREALLQPLQMLAPFAVDELLGQLRDSMRRRQRLTLVDSLSEVGRRAVVEGRSPAEALAPVLRELRRHDDHPWYFTRNLVAILGHSGASDLPGLLAPLLDSKVDPRVVTEIVRGLAASDSDAAREVVRSALQTGLLSDPAGVAAAVPYLLRADRAGTVESALRLLRDERSAAAGAGALLGLALEAGAEATPLLARVLQQRAGLLRRPAFGEAARLGAVEALGCLSDPPARALLEAAGKDSSAAARRRAAELRGTTVDEAVQRARQQLGLEVPH